jgi:hypothetical protein
MRKSSSTRREFLGYAIIEDANEFVRDAIAAC